MAEVTNDKKVFSLSEVSVSIQRIIAEKYKQSYWIKAEMNKLNYYKGSGHCYPELVEKRDGQVIAQMRGTLWNSDYVKIQQQFQRFLNEPLKDGITILFLARVKYDPVHGLALQILDIDPAYTLGELEREKRETIAKLKEDGLFNRNKLVKLPALPQRIAIISVSTSKGYSDFIEKIEPNPWGYKIFHMLFPSILQGEKAVTGIIDQLNKIRKVVHHFDAVAIIRGGGGDVGLTCYNHYELCRTIALYPIAVLTGIGHSTNETVAEMVAHHNSITPTDLANFIHQQFHNVSVPLTQAQESVSRKAMDILKNQKAAHNNLTKYAVLVVERAIQKDKGALSHNARILATESKHFLRREAETGSYQIEKLSRGVKSLVVEQRTAAIASLSALKHLVGTQVQQRKMMLTRFQDQIKKDVGICFIKEGPLLSNAQQIVQSASKNMIQGFLKDVQHAHDKITMLDPANVLKRGFTITLVNGRLLQSIVQVNDHDQIETITVDGRVISTATNKTKSS